MELYEISKLLELLGMITTIIGSILLANNKTFYAFSIFLISNLFMIFVGISNLLLGLTIQMIIFIIVGYDVITHINKNKYLKYIILLIITLYFLFIFIYFYHLDLTQFQFELNKIDIFAATLAIIGSWVMRFQLYKIKIFGFILFILADVLYSYIAYEKSLYYFMFQSITLVFVSLYGIFTLLNNRN